MSYKTHMKPPTPRATHDHDMLLPAIHEPVVLSASDLHEKMWEEYVVTRDPKLRQQLAGYYLELVQAIAAQMAAGLPSCVDAADLAQEGYFGLYRAIGAFDLSYKVKFTTYASSAIRGAMLDSLRRSAWAPRGVRQRASEIDRARVTMTARLERPPTDEEMAQHLGVSVDEFMGMQQEGRVTMQYSLTRDAGDRENGEMELLPADRRVEDPTLKAQHEDMRALLLKGFDAAERLIVILYYFERMTMKEIGATLGMCESRVSQKHTLIVERIKGMLGDRVREFENDD